MSKIVFWGIILIAIIIIGRRLYAYFHNNAQPQHSVQVLVVDKHTREFMGKTHPRQTELPAPRINYYVTFRPLEDADEREFQISQHLYEQLTPTQTGTLVFRGSRFIAFEPDSASQDSG